VTCPIDHSRGAPCPREHPAIVEYGPNHEREDRCEKCGASLTYGRPCHRCPTPCPGRHECKGHHACREHGAHAPVAIGDTFDRAGDSGGAWEVTGDRGILWVLQRGDTMVFTTAAQLQDRALWVPARAI